MITCSISTMDRGPVLGATAELACGGMFHTIVASCRRVAMEKAIRWAVEVMGADEILLEDEDLRWKTF